MIWAYIIWIACLSFVAPSSTANLQKADVETKVSDELHFIVNNDILISEEEPLNFSFDAIAPKHTKVQKFTVAVKFYTVNHYRRHTEKLNPLTLDLPPPLCSHIA